MNSLRHDSRPARDRHAIDYQEAGEVELNFMLVELHSGRQQVMKNGFVIYSFYVFQIQLKLATLLLNIVKYNTKNNHV